MDKVDTIKILAILKTAYPAFYKDMPDEDVEQTIDLWASLFAGDRLDIVIEAVKSLTCTLKFPPTIADVKDKIALITQPVHMTEMEAWGMVSKALQKAGWYAEEAYSNLPPLIQRIVGSPNQLKEWAMMESETVNSVIQSNFMRSYKAAITREKEYTALPESTKEMIAGLSQKMLMEG